MAENGGEVYTAHDVNSLLQYSNDALAVQSSRVPVWYPDDYIYYPLLDNDGESSIVKVGDDYLSAWMKRSKIGGDFDNIVLLTKDQVEEIYKNRPDALPDIVGGQAKTSEYTDKEVYVNTNLDVNHPEYEKPAEDYSIVYFNKKTGDIVSEAYAFDANSSAYDNKTPYYYQEALLPNNVIADNNVSVQDLDQQLEGYKLSDQVAVKHSEDSARKSVGEKLLIQAISGKNIVYEGQHIQVGGVISNLDAARSGNHEPSLIVEDKALIYEAGNINFEDALYGKKEKPLVEEKQSTPVREKFNKESSTVVINANNQAVPNGYTEKLNKIMDNISDQVDEGRQNRINRSVVPVLSYLKNTTKYGDLFDIEANRAMDFLRDQGLDIHANAIEIYTQNPSRETYREAKDAVKSVEKQKVVIANENEEIQKSIDHGNNNLVDKFVQAATHNGSPDTAQEIIDNIKDVMPKEVVDQVCENIIKIQGFESVSCPENKM